MTKLLKMLVADVQAMGEAHDEQSEVIKKTVLINQDIAEKIKNENEQFSTISAMAESNATDTMEVTTQANSINEMVDQITKLLKTDE